ncbi:hypothetical protein [Bacteroides reticulotermitis]|uniref:hypothetical protein n=1 Tax=Bacteroides reticulotermitis TaxID=1133319 RepID=UPI003A86300E
MNFIFRKLSRTKALPQKASTVKNGLNHSPDGSLQLTGEKNKAIIRFDKPNETQTASNQPENCLIIF